jgi:hypothetical protein
VQYCTANSECTHGRVCTFGSIDGNRCDTPCAADHDCQAGETCLAPRCALRCGRDEDCQSGEICGTIGTTRRCVVRACNDDTDCGSGDVCRIQREPRLATEPTVLARAHSDEPAFTMWIELSEPSVPSDRAIYRAVSTDGVQARVDPAAPVLLANDQAHAPSAVRVGDAIFLYYEHGDGEELRAAESADGTTFGPAAAVLTASAAGTTALRTPGVVLLPDGDVAVYYENGDRQGIGLACGAPGATLRPEGVVLSMDQVTDPPASQDSAAFWLDITALGSPHAALATGTDGVPFVRLWFTAFGQESGASLELGEVASIDPNYSIGYAAAPAETPAALTVWPYNPIFDRITAFVDHRSELAPAVVQATSTDGDARESYFLYYVGANADGDVLEALGVARNGE